MKVTPIKGTVRYKAWVGQPADKDGYLLTCERCDRAAIMMVNRNVRLEQQSLSPLQSGTLAIFVGDGTPRCSWHLNDGLGGDGRNIARAAEAARKKKPNV